MRAALCLTAALGALLVPTAGAAPSCRHLLVDPAGDASWLGTRDVTGRVEDGDVVDLVAGDLASDRKALTVVIRVQGSNPEGGTRYFDHSWEMSFATPTERFIAVAMRSRTGGDRFALYRMVAGEKHPEGSQPAGASAAQGVDTDVTGTVDEVRGVVRMRVPVTAFSEFGGLGRSLTHIRSLAWSGAAAHSPDGNGGASTWGSSDFGSTSKSYRVGARGCV